MTGVRRLAAVVVLTGALFGVGGAMSAPPAAAHPLGNFTVNRYSGIVLSPGRIEVTYVLDMAEIPTFQVMPAVDADGDGDTIPAERQAWADRTAGELVTNIALSVDGRSTQLRVESASMELLSGQGGLEVLYLRAVFSAEASGSGSVSYRDGNDPDRIGWREITVRSRPGVAIERSDVPRVSTSDELRSYPDDLLASPPDVTEASFSFHPGAGSPGGDGSAEGEGSTSPGGSGGAFAELITWRLTPGVFLLSILAAFAFGGLHALGPGHGKTIMAAYLVGAGARLRQALAVGVAVTLMHTASVLGLGLIALYASRVFPAERVYPWLSAITGGVVLALGVGLLVSRVRARRRDAGHPHVHGHEPAQAAVTVPHRELVMASVSAGSRPSGQGGLPDPVDDHPHDHHLGHEHEARPIRPAGMTGRGLAALAVSGGILPSPTALVVLLGAIALDRLAYGLALIAAFSLGLAAALMAVGIVAVRARSFVEARMGSRLSRWLPLASAGVIAAVGVFLSARAVLQLG